MSGGMDGVRVDEVMATVAERLAERFAHLPLSTVVRVLTDCVASHPQASASEVEQAAMKALDELVADQG